MRRKTREQLQADLEAQILSGSSEGLAELKTAGSKGRGVETTQKISRGEFVLEYRGELLDGVTAEQRQLQYEKQGDERCYVLDFQVRGRSYSIDATAETGTLGRLINHSRKKPNLVPKVVEIKRIPHVVFFALRNIATREELLYDYVDRSTTWLIDS